MWERERLQSTVPQGKIKSFCWQDKYDNCTCKWKWERCLLLYKEILTYGDKWCNEALSLRIAEAEYLESMGVVNRYSSSSNLAIAVLLGY